MSSRNLDSAEYRKNFAHIHDRVFSPGDDVVHPFVDPSWKVVLLVGGLQLDDAPFSALAETARDRGDATLVIVDRTTGLSDPPPVEVTWDHAALVEAAKATVLGHLEVDVFGASGTWGMVASPETFAVLGGEGGFMKDFVTLCGGEEVLQSDFIAAVRANEVGWELEGTKFYNELLAAAGWS